MTASPDVDTRIEPFEQPFLPADEAPTSIAAPDGRSHRVTAGIDVSLCLSAALVLGFLIYLFGGSAVVENSGQQIMYESFADQLAQAVAPISTPVEGTPIAILRIPQIHLDNEIVVSGTTGADLTKGPGLRRDTPVPGQPGVSVIYGRNTTFGGPFAHLGLLRRGDHFTVITGQGTAVYQVASFGSGDRPPLATSPNRIVLTSAKAGLVPTTTVSVSADLISSPQPSPSGRQPAIGSDERGLAPDTDVLLPLTLWGQGLLIVVILAALAVRRWQRWPAYVCLAPVLLAVLWNIYENVAVLLPNVY